MKIITVSREFGSGGRELGKRLSDCLGWPYYDREIISAVARRNALDEGYVEDALEQGDFRGVPLTIGRTFAYLPSMPHDSRQLLQEQRRVLRALAAHGDCIIVGRNADLILAEHRPLKLFVYADLESRLRRVPGAQLRRRAFHSPRAGAEAPAGGPAPGPAPRHALRPALGETGGVSPVREHHRPVPEDAGPPGGGVCPLLVLPAGDPLTRARKRDCRKSLRLQVVSPDAHAAGENRSELDSRLRARTTRVFFHKLSAPDAFSGVRGAFPITASAADQADAHRADLGRDTGGHHTVIGDEHLIAYGKTASDGRIHKDLLGCALVLDQELTVPHLEDGGLHRCQKDHLTSSGCTPIICRSRAGVPPGARQEILGQGVRHRATERAVPPHLGGYSRPHGGTTVQRGENTMSLYPNKIQVDGVPCGLILRGSANGTYLAVFEREMAELARIEQIDWSRPAVVGESPLPAGYGFQVRDIRYAHATRSYTVLLQTAEQYLGMWPASRPSWGSWRRLFRRSRRSSKSRSR